MGYLDNAGLARFFTGIKSIFATKALATSSSDGLMTAAQVRKLEGIEDNANKLPNIGSNSAAKVLAVNADGETYSWRTVAAVHPGGDGYRHVPTVKDGEGNYTQGNRMLAITPNGQGVVWADPAAVIPAAVGGEGGSNGLMHRDDKAKLDKATGGANREIQCGQGAMTVASNSYGDIPIVFASAFSGVPRIAVTATAPASRLSVLRVGAIDKTATGCKIRVYNGYTSELTVNIDWIAIN